MEAPSTPPGRASSWAARNAELDARIRDLHERNAQLSVALTATAREQGAVGSTPEQVAKAEQLARAANKRARQASQRAAMMRLHAASAHDRVARLHALLADADQAPDADEHREKAALHRRLAGEDRAAADAISHSHSVDPPTAGDS